MNIKSSSLLFSWFTASAYAFLSNASPSPAATTIKSPPETPGALRRQVFGEPPKLSLPLPLISAIVAVLKLDNPMDAVPVFFKTLKQVQSKNTVLPIAHKPFSSFCFPPDCISAQQKVQKATKEPFLRYLTPSMVDIEENDRNGQLKWIQDNVSRLHDWKLSHGAIYFQSWDIFKDEEGVNQVSKLLGTPCRDPKEVRGPAPLLDGSSTIYETLNNEQDAKTHLGLHYEGIPGIMPTSALFSCFRPADTGGEFLLCDGRRVFADLNTTTLANLEGRKLRPTFAELPDWISHSPTSFMFSSETMDRYWREVLALVTDIMKPTDDFLLDVFPSDESTTLKLTTHAAVPVILHPVTSQPVWFSGMDAGHQGNFQRDNPHLSRESGGKYAEEVFDVRYGNGEEISEIDLENVRQACKANTKELLMQPGDAVYLDNFTVLHGRKTFQGTRKHTVVWFLD